MRYRLFIAGMLFLVCQSPVRALEGDEAASRERSDANTPAVIRRWLSQDLQLTTGDLLSQKTATGRHLLVCRNGFEMAVAGCRFSGDSAVVRIEPARSKGSDVARYMVWAYLKSPTSQGQTGNLQEFGFAQTLVEEGKAAVLRMDIDGEIYVTADTRRTGSPQGLLLYREALEAFEAAGLRESLAGESGAVPQEVGSAQRRTEEPEAGYTVSVAPLAAQVEGQRSFSETGDEVITIIGRVYARWQEQDAPGSQPRVVELEADNLVFWRRGGDPNHPAADLSSTQHEGVSDIYVSGDVRLTQGQRTIRASELYYDLQRQRGLARDVVFSTFDASRDVPIYVRASELRQVAANEFDAKDVSVTASEFRTPQLSLAAGNVHIIDRMQDPERDERSSTDSRFDARMDNIRLKYYDTTLFAWPSLRSNFQRPDTPIRGLSVGHDNTYGTSVETSWFLSRILGLREPEGTDSSLELDYYSKRGLGAGVDIQYERENYFGRMLGYVINDSGEDRLSRTQQSVPVPQETRGRLELRHRHFLLYGWQLTAEASYLSDKNFLEQFYRTEFNAGKEQETLVHLKRIEDNWGLAFLGKSRINSFLDQVEELPSAEFHWTGQSLFQDHFTFYSDSQASRYRYRYSTDSVSAGSEEFFNFTMTRNELDMPLAAGRSKIVPFVAATFGYEDGAGFQAALDDSPLERDDLVSIGEAGVRVSAQPLWRVYPDVKSEFWDLNQLRHVIRPELTAVVYTEDDPVVHQRDTLEVGLRQRWQTKRGPVGRQRTVDWLRWNLDFVWVSDTGQATAGPDQLLWNQPFIPLVNRMGGVLPPHDRRTTALFGPQRNYIGTDVTLRLSDTTSILGDMNFDMQSGVVQQLDVGFSRLRWPNLSYYVGSRYLRRIVSGDERGSNAVTFAATYVLDPRYTLVFSEQYDFDYGAGIQSDITLIRKYHRLNLALTVSADESLDEQRIVLSLWPQGVPELGFGLRRYMELGATETY